MNFHNHSTCRQNTDKQSCLWIYSTRIRIVLRNKCLLQSFNFYSTRNQSCSSHDFSKPGFILIESVYFYITSGSNIIYLPTWKKRELHKNEAVAWFIFCIKEKCRLKSAKPHYPFSQRIKASLKPLSPNLVSGFKSNKKNLTLPVETKRKTSPPPRKHH